MALWRLPRPFSPIRWNNSLAGLVLFLPLATGLLGPAARAGIELIEQPDSARPLLNPTLTLTKYVRQVTPEEILAMRDRVLQGLQVRGFKVKTLDVQYVSDLARRGQVVALDATVDGQKRTWYGLRHALNDLGPNLEELTELYKDLSGPEQTEMIPLPGGVGTSVHSSIMKQWSDTDVDFMVLDPQFTGDPNALRNDLPHAIAVKAARYVRSSILEFIRRKPEAIFGELKAGNLQLEPFHPSMPPKGEKWSMEELIKGEKTVEVHEGGTKRLELLKLEEAIQHDTYVKFDFYVPGYGDRTGETVELTACFRFGGITPEGKVYLRQSERQLHFPEARDTKWFADEEAFLLSTMSNEFEYPMPTTERANQLMLSKLAEVLTVSTDNPYPRFDKANKTIRARANFWHDYAVYQEVTGDKSSSRESLIKDMEAYGNDPEVLRLANLYAETSANLYIVEFGRPLRNEREDMISYLRKYTQRLGADEPALASALLKDGLATNTPSPEFKRLLAAAKTAVQSLLSQYSLLLLYEKFPGLYRYMIWVSGQAQYLSHGPIGTRGLLVAFPVPQRIKDWYRKLIPEVVQRFPHVMRHNPDDLHGTAVFGGNTTPQTRDAIAVDAEEAFKGRNIPLRPRGVEVLGSEGTYVGWVFDVERPEDAARMRRFQYAAISKGSKPTRFLGNIHPHFTLFWIPKTATAAEKAEFEEFKKWFFERVKDAKDEIFPDGKMIWSGVPMILESNRSEHNPNEMLEREIPERMYRVRVPAQPLASDLASGAVDASIETEVTDWTGPRDVMIAWETPGSIHRWMEYNGPILQSVFPLLSFSSAEDLFIPLTLLKQVDPTTGLTLERKALEPWNSASIIEEFPIADKKDPSKKVLMKREMKGSRLFRSGGVARYKATTLSSTRDAVGIRFGLSKAFREEIDHARALIASMARVIPQTLADPDSLYLQVARSKQFHSDGSALNESERATASAQLDLLATFLTLSATIEAAKTALSKVQDGSEGAQALKSSLPQDLNLLQLGAQSHKVNWAPEFARRLEAARAAVTQYDAAPSRPSAQLAFNALTELEASLVVKSIQDFSNTLAAKPHFYGAVPPAQRQSTGRKFIKLPLPVSRSRSVRDVDCTDAMKPDHSDQ